MEEGKWVDIRSEEACGSTVTVPGTAEQCIMVCEAEGMRRCLRAWWEPHHGWPPGLCSEHNGELLNSLTLERDTVTVTRAGWKVLPKSVI